MRSEGRQRSSARRQQCSCNCDDKLDDKPRLRCWQIACYGNLSNMGNLPDNLSI